MNKIITSSLMARNLTNQCTKRHKLEQVEPNTDKWNTFIEISASYVQESWPDALEGKSLLEFQAEYDQELRGRLLEGGRGLYLFECQEQPAGLLNYYLDTFRNMPVLNIAEFSIVPDFRRQGFGRVLFELAQEKARENHLTYIAAEVDKDQESANLFWDSLGLELDGSGERNLYWLSLKD